MEAEKEGELIPNLKNKEKWLSILAGGEQKEDEKSSQIPEIEKSGLISLA